MSQDELAAIEARKKKAERGWLAIPPPPPPRPQPHDRTDKWRRMFGQLPPETDVPPRRHEAERRYAHLVNKPRPWLADPTERNREDD